MRWPAVALKSFLTILTLLVLALPSLLGLALLPKGLELICRWLPELVPELQIVYSSGSLRAGKITRLVWRDDAVHVELKGIAWQLDASCLLREIICLRELAIADVLVSTTPTANSSLLDLKPVILPLEIELERGSIDRLAIRTGTDSTLEITALALQGSWRNSLLQLQNVSANMAGLSARAQGHIDLVHQLPMQLVGELLYKPGPDTAYRSDIKLRGNLGDLKVKGVIASAEPLALSLAVAGDIDFLAEPIALAVRVASQAPIELQLTATEGLKLDGLTAELSGGLDTLNVVASTVTNNRTFGTNDLSVLAQWNGQTLNIIKLRLAGESGELAMGGVLAFAPELSWEMALDLTGFCPAKLDLELVCSLTGPITVAGSLPAAGLQLDAAVTVAGTVNEFPAGIDLVVRKLAGGLWQVPELNLSSGDNTVIAAGELGEALDMVGKIKLGDLSQLVENYTGTGEASFKLGGSLARPRVDMAVAMTSVAVADVLVSELDLQARWLGWEQQNLGTLRIRQLVMGKDSIGDIDLNLQGAPAKFDLGLSLARTSEQLDLRCQGGVDKDYNGAARCSGLEVNSPRAGGTWTLEDDLALAWKVNPLTLTVDNFCLHNQSARACNQEQLLLGAAGTIIPALRLQHLPLSWFKEWLPAGLALEGELAMDLAVDLPAAKSDQQSDRPTVSLVVHSEQINAGVEAAGTMVYQALTELRLSVAKYAQRTRIDWSANVGASGSSKAGFDITGSSDDRQIVGRALLDSLDLAPFALAFDAVLDASGVLTGQIDVSGPLVKPELAGRLQILQARLAHERLPLPIDHFDLDLVFAGPGLSLSGQFETGAGNGQVAGQVDWSGDDWVADLRLQADTIQLQPNISSQVSLVPDIRLKLNSKAVVITGTVAVPAAKVVIEALPELARSVSSDTVIIGATGADEPYDYDLNLQLLLGENVSFSGLGAQAKLAGNVVLMRKDGESMTARGRIDIVSGRYIAYGQRLEVEEGSLYFNGLLDRPEIRLTALRPLDDPDTQVGVRVRGDARAPDIEVFSKPTMNDSAALTYLLTGRPPEEGVNLELALASALLQAGISANGPNTNALAENFGISNFRVAARQVGTGTEVDMSGYLTPDWFVRYGTSTFEKVNTIRVRYRLTGRLFLEAVSGVESAIDVLYSLRL